MSDYAYISVIQWPESFGRERCVIAVVDVTGMDPFHAGQRVAKGTPVVLNRMERGERNTPGPAEAAVARLRKHGAMVFAPTDSAMGAVPLPMKLKTIQKVPDAPRPMFMAELWSGGKYGSGQTHHGIIAEEMFLIVRARVKQTSTNVHVDTELKPTFSPGMGLRFKAESHVVRESSLTVRDVMDIYMRDGTRCRIDGTKFNFSGLGKERGYTDNVNADKTAMLLAESNRRTLIDTEYNSFNCSEGLVKGAGTWLGKLGRTTRDDMPLFEFYSVWAYLMYRELAAGRA